MNHLVWPLLAALASSVACGATPSDVTYTIISDNSLFRIKRSVDVRLDRKVSKEVLRSLAIELRNADKGEYQRTFIVYYLPGMTVGAGGWATTHFNPELEVRILGLTAEEEKVRSQAQSPSREQLGVWVDNRPFMGTISIFREGGKLLVEKKYKDGSTSKKEVVEKPSRRGRRFEEKEGAAFGEYFLIDRQGKLQLWDEDGHITTAERLR